MNKVTVSTVNDPTDVRLGFGHPTEVILTYDLGSVKDFKLVSISFTESSIAYYMYYNFYWSADSVNWFLTTSTIASNSDYTRVAASEFSPSVDISSQFIYLKLQEGSYGIAEPESSFRDFQILINDLVVDGMFLRESNPSLSMLLSDPFVGFSVYNGKLDEMFLNMSFPHITTQVFGDGGGGVVVDPTSTNIISGNVSKLNLPFVANVVAVSIGIDPQVVGETVSDIVTGDYTLDVYPHTDELLLYVAPDYGRAFGVSIFVSAGLIMHPTTPNKFVYVAQNDGFVGSVEPNWGEGQIVSNEVTFSPVPLYRPLMNGFVKPTVTPI